MKKETKLNKMKEVVKTLTPSKYKMGEMFTLIVGHDEIKSDNREYYSGRGAKYNASIRHGDIVEKITVKELCKRYSVIMNDRKERGERRREYEIFIKSLETHDGMEKCIIEKCLNVDFKKELKDSAFNYNSYSGCGSYWVAVKNGRIVASVKMGDCPHSNDLYELYRDVSKKILTEYGVVISGEGSGTMFYAKYKNDLKYFNTSKTYDVPSIHGGIHTNFEAGN